MNTKTIVFYVLENILKMNVKFHIFMTSFIDEECLKILNLQNACIFYVYLYFIFWCNILNHLY